MTFVCGLIPNSQIPSVPLNVPGARQLSPPGKVASGVPGPDAIISLTVRGEFIYGLLNLPDESNSVAPRSDFTAASGHCAPGPI